MDPRIAFFKALLMHFIVIFVLRRMLKSKLDEYKEIIKEQESIINSRNTE